MSPAPRRIAALPARIYGPDQVDVAYEPWRVLRDSPQRIGPGAAAAPVLGSGGAPVVMRAETHVGRQSTRNPACSDRPPLRPALGGWVWVYGLPPNSRKSGWVALADLEPDPDHPESACGPAEVDFDRRDPSLCSPHCDGRPLQRVEPAAGVSVVRAREVYLRYSPQGTAFRYLQRGEAVRALCRWRSGRLDYTGVEVRTARWAPRGTRGWVASSALRPQR
jgi:hypothetical protein